MESKESHRRKIRSFVRRGGRLSRLQQQILDLPPENSFFHEEDLNEISSQALFGNDKPLVVEIGFGMGDATLHFAREDRQRNFLAFDVHRPGVGRVLAAIQEEDLFHLKVVEGDAQETLLRLSKREETVSAFHIFFPDPWQKKKHQKRRLISTEFVGCLLSYLKPQGYLLVSTDWSDYAEQIEQVLGEFQQLENHSQRDFERTPWRPITKFEKKGLEKGHSIKDFLYVKKEF